MMHPRSFVISWIILIFSCNVGLVHGEAKFLSHVPYEADELQPFDSNEHSNEDIHDSIVKLPGRIYPKLPYTLSDNNNLHNSNLRNTRLVSSKTDDGLGPRTSSLRTNPDSRNYADHRKSWERYPNEQNDEEDQIRHQQSSTTAPERTGGPRFDRNMSRNVTAVVGRTVDLVCRVVALGDLTVSWLQGVNMLTVGGFRYSTDTRISVSQNEGRDEWRLRIKDVREEDAGPYECQISSFPVLSFIVELVVADEAAESITPVRDDIDHPIYHHQPTAELIVSPSPHLKVGDILNFTCLVTHSPGQLVRVLWYFEDQILHPSIPVSETSLPFSRNGLSNNHIPLSLSEPSTGIRHSHSQTQDLALGPRNIYKQSFNPVTINQRPEKAFAVSAGGTSGSNISKGPHPGVDGAKVTAFQFMVGTASKERAGKYACKPHGGIEAFTMVYVHHEEDTAIFSGAYNATSLQSVFYLIFLHLLLLFSYWPY